MSSLVSGMADVLVAHFYHSAEFAGIGGRWSIECNCDYIVTADSHPEVEAAFAAHQAAALSAAGFGPVQEARTRALLDAAEALDLQPPKLKAQYVAALRLYALEPWRLETKEGQ